MFRRITAIAIVTVRSAVRSRFVVCMLFLLLLTTITLPMTIKGDGTLAGEVQVLLHYTLGLAGVIIGIASLWIACSCISLEIESRQIHMVAVKPIHRWEIWVGKWFALLAVNAVLLAVSGVMVYALLQWRVSSSGASDVEKLKLREELLVGRRHVIPRAESVHEQAHLVLDKMIAEGRLGPDESLDATFASIREHLLARKQIVVPGDIRKWEFDIPEAFHATLRGATLVSLRFTFSSTSRNRKALNGKWIVSNHKDTEIYAFAIKNYLSGTHTISIPASTLSPGESMSISFANADTEESGTVVFGSDRAVEILARGGSFEANMVRALVVVLCHLALLSAIGLAAGSVFSFPVAVFVASALLAISAIVHYSETSPSVGSCCSHHHGVAREDKSILYKASAQSLRYLAVIVEPAMEIESIGSLSDGILVSSKQMGRAVLVLGIIYPAILGLAAAWFLSRRELAIPA
ncbi:MAG: hypothetical protein KAH23_04500 [Kiritimatiellae bacterium]|nr:hypothetical protein [Kiritimatiellia bacterium]